MAINCGESWKQKQREMNEEYARVCDTYDRQAKDSKLEMVTTQRNNSTGAAFFFAILSIVFLVVLISRASHEGISEKKVDNLFMGHSGNSFNVKTTTIDKRDGETIIAQRSLKNVQWAQLRLYPTIGCARPTLFYLADNDQQVKRIEVNDAIVVGENNY